MSTKRTGHDLPETFGGWLWRDGAVIPRNELSMIVGYDGTGKTGLVLGLAARLSTGVLTGMRERVFLSMAEDAESMTKARLTAYGADLGRTLFQPLRANGLPDSRWLFPIDLKPFEGYLVAHEATVALIDSLDFHVGKLAAQQARETLGYLHEIAQRHAITIIFVHHFNKGGRSIDQGIGGGRGVKAAMRCILVWGERPPTPPEMLTAPSGAEIAADEEDREEHDPKTRGTHVLAVHKNSYGRKFPVQLSWAYTASEVTHPFDPDETVLRFEYECDTPTSPNEVFLAQTTKAAAAKNSDRKIDRARELIIRFLASAGGAWMPAPELLQNVMAAGISQRTVEQARSQLAKEGQIESHRQGGSAGAHQWRIAFDIPNFPPDS